MNDLREIDRSLTIAHALIGLGVPIFLAQPDPLAPTGYALPGRWHEAVPNPAVVDDWRPGMALGMVTGHVFDLVDVDPRSGGREDDEWMPQAYLVADTPSGGRHYYVRCLGVESRDGAYPGVDLKSGTIEGRGRGFGFIAPTVRVSKVDGLARAYRWRPGPEAWYGRGPDPDDRSGDALRARVVNLRAATRRSGDAPRRVPASVAALEWTRACDRLTRDVAYWAANGWGGSAHAGLLAHTTHLARLDPERAEEAFLGAFEAARCAPDEADLLKLESALDNAVPDVIVPDEEMDPQELFWAGGSVLDDPDAPEERRARTALSSDGWEATDVHRILTARRWRGGRG
jgi:hypothetical protein